MEDLKIEYFKCFEESIELDLHGRQNLLLSGENGAGKSSLFDAVKMVFYRNRMLPPTLPLVGLAGQQGLSNKYNNKRNQQRPFEILVDGVSYSNYNSANTDAFFISCNDLRQHNEISIDNIFANLFFPVSILQSPDTYWSDVFLQYVNDCLHEDFYEDIHLEKLQGTGRKFKVIDPIRGINVYNHLADDYNEAKLDIIILVILFQVILCTPKNLPRLLVMDDIINSLDMANRGLVAKFIMANFQEEQLLLFTHNVSFYNLFSYAISNYKNVVGNWKKMLLYEVNGEHRLEKDESPESVETIRHDYKANPANGQAIGNRVRKQFEYLLHEYARLMQFGDYMETNAIISRIVNTNSNEVFLQINGDKVYSVQDMLLAMKGIAENTPAPLIRSRINKLFVDYDSSKFFKKLIPIVKDLTLFQKLTLHQLSHTQNGLPTFSSKEIEYSLYLLEKMEKVVNGLKTMNTTGNVYKI